MRTLSISLALPILLAALGASAVPVTFYEDVDSSGGYDLGEERTGGVNTAGEAIFDWSFDLDGGTQLIASTAIQISFTTFDNNFIVEVNGVEVVPIDPGDPAVFTPGISTPWTANGNGLARLVIDLSTGSIDFASALTTSSTSLTTGLVYNQPTILPLFQDGQNSIVITNPDGPGPDAVDFSILGSVQILVPEPGTGLLALAGLAGLAYLGRPRRSPRR